MFNSFMKEALNQAKKALNNDEVPIGCVIVNIRNDKIISKACNQNIKLNDPTAHCEIIAIRKACKKLQTDKLTFCDIYVTLEPCLMCAAAISNTHIRKLYYGAENKKEGAIQNGPKIYKNKFCNYRPEVYSGLMEEECSNILKKFFKLKRK